MKIGIAIPCHVDDRLYLEECLKSVANLDPQPFCHLINLNRGEISLKQIRSNLFDELFDKQCDVVLNCSSDFWLFPHILAHVRRDIVSDFCSLQNRLLADVISTGIHLFYPDCWTGCYSLPINVWKETIKPSWDGSDGSIKQILGRNYKFVKKPLYYAMRPWRKETTEPFLATMPLLKRLKWRMLRVR